MDFSEFSHTSYIIFSEESIAFTASATNNQNVGDEGKFTFDNVWTNVGGGYQIATSDFVCPVTGYYLFAFSMETQGQQHV